MPNAIPAEQNSLENIRIFRASRQAMADGKLISRWQLGLTIGATSVGLVLPFFYPDLKPWTALLGIAVLLLDVIFLEPSLKKKQETKAKLQEQFDTNLYDIPWSTLKCGQRIETEDIVELADRHEKRYLDPAQAKLLDWYPADVGVLPIEYARFVCQRANMRWDSTLRRKISTYYNRTLVALWLAASVYALSRHMSMSDTVLSVVVPLLPTSIRIIRERRKQDETADSSERSRSYLDSTWERSLKDRPTPEYMTSEARQLQNELFDRRRRAPELPEYLYQSTRDELERQMKEASRRMIQEVILALGLPGTTHAQP